MEWLLSNGKDVDTTNINCGDVTYLYNTHLMFRLYQKNHVSEILRKMSRKELTNDIDLFHARCKFVLNRISKDSYIQFLKRLELKKYKSSMFTQIYQEFIDTANIIFMIAQQKDNEALNLLSSRNVSENLYSFVATNGLINVIKNLVKNSMPKRDYDLAISKLLDYKRENDDTIFIPKSCSISSLIPLVYDNREIIMQLISFDNEINLLNDLVKYINSMLFNYKKMFKVNRISLIALLGSKSYMISE